MAKENIYPFAVAKVRVYENRLLTEQNFIQMAEAKSVEECIRTLSEAGYNGGTTFGVNEFESVLSSEMGNVYKLMAELVPDENFMDIFLCKNDYHNAKVIVKSEISGIDGEKYLLGGGLIPIETLKEAIFDRDYNKLPVVMAKALASAYEMYAKTQSGQYIDMVIDKAYFKYISEIAKNSKNDFIIGYVQKICDLTNLKIFARVRKMKKSFWHTFENAFVFGGTLSYETFEKAFSDENYKDALKGTGYNEVLEYMDKGFTEFEKACDDYMMEYVRGAKYMSLTLEPLIAYIHAKETEVKTVRIIIASKINGIDSDTIKERLREAYV